MMRLFLGDCRKVMKRLHREGVRVHAIVTDPPYHLGFMGKAWDKGDVAFQQETWELARKLLLPGGHLLAFGGTRTYHRLAVAVEDAGFEIRDMIGWLYGQGFPKSQDVSKFIDKAAGAKREVIGKAKGMGKQNPEWNGTAQGRAENSFRPEYDLTIPATEAAKQWDGWGTALKPAQEPIVMARKPLSQKTVAANVLKHGAGAINIDASRIGAEGVTGKVVSTSHRHREEWGVKRVSEYDGTKRGRHPANIIHDGSDEVLAVFPETSNAGHFPKETGGIGTDSGIYGKGESRKQVERWSDNGKGSAARFFYSAKTSKKDRGEYNNHVTVKPTDLMRYLIQMVVPPGGVVLDPFMGSGSTGKAAWLVKGVDFIGIELGPENFAIAARRIAEASGKQLPEALLSFGYDDAIRAVSVKINR